MRIRSLASAVALPMFLVAYWQIRNHGFWPDDSGRYMGMASRAFLQTRGWNIFAGLIQSYRELLNHYPAGSMIGPVLGTPFALLSGGRMLAAVALHNSFCFLVFLIYVYLLSSWLLTPARAAVATSLVGSVPFIFSTTYVFMPELPLLMCTAAVLYHLKRSEFFSNRVHSLSCWLWFALAICVRPAESVLMLSGPLIASMIVAKKKNNLGSSDLFACLILIALAALGLAHAISLNHPFGIGDFLIDLLPPLAGGAAAFRFRKKLELSSPFMDSFLICYTTVSIWLIPLAAPFWNWAWHDSFGARVRHEFMFSYILHEILSRMMSMPFLTLFLTASAGIAFSKKPQRARFSFLWIMGLTQLLLVLGFFAYNTDVRYRYAPVFVLYLIFLLVALFQDFPLKNTRLAIVVLVCAFQTSTVFKTDFGIPVSEAGAAYFGFLRVPDPRSPSEDFVEALRKILPPGRHALDVITPFVDRPFNFITEPDVLSMVIRAKGLDWTLDKSPQTDMKDFLVVGPRDFSVFEGMPVNAGWEWSERLSKELQAANDGHTLAKLGFSYFGEIPVSFGPNYKSSYLVLRAISSSSSKFP